MRGVLLLALTIALVVVLIPFPGLLWFSLAGLAALWLATPVQTRKGKGSS